MTFKLPPKRPLSPHLQVWKWHPTMLSSILHRATGMALYLGALGLVLWIAAAAHGGVLYKRTEHLSTSLTGQAILLAFSYALFYHMLNGLRHLIWDAGGGYEPQQANRVSWFIMLAAAFLTGAGWAVVLMMRGGFS